MSLSRRKFLLTSAAAVSSAAALSAACAPAPPATPTAASAAPAAPPATATVTATTAPAVATPTTAPAPAATATLVAPLKIGMLLPYNESSIGVDIGLNQKRAADLYLKRQGGKLAGRAVGLVYSSESVEAAINKVKIKTLLETEKVELLLGGVSAETAYVMRDAADAAKLVYIDTNATANAITRSVADCNPTCKSKYVFRSSATSWQLSQPLGAWVARSGVKDVYLVGVDETFGTESMDAFEAGLTANGARATDRAAVASGGDWATAVATIKAQSSKNVFAAFHTDDAEGFLKAWAEQGMRDAGYTLYGPGLLTEQEVLEQARSAAEGVITSHFWSSEIATPENTSLVDQFPREYTDDDTGAPVQLTAYAVAMWDAVSAIDAALQKTSGSTRDADALIAALQQVATKSPRGMFAFDPATHNPTQDIYIREVKSQSGKLVNAIREKIPAVADPG